MAEEKVLSRKEFVRLVAQDPKAAGEDIGRTIEDFSLRLWKIRYLYTGRDDPVSGNGNPEQPPEGERIEL